MCCYSHGREFSLNNKIGLIEIEPKVRGWDNASLLPLPRLNNYYVLGVELDDALYEWILGRNCNRFDVLSDRQSYFYAINDNGDLDKHLAL